MNTLNPTEEKSLPIHNIDEIDLLEVIERINSLSFQELQTVKKYESNHRNRPEIINTINFRLRIFRENGRFQM